MTDLYTIRRTSLRSLLHCGTLCMLSMPCLAQTAPAPPVPPSSTAKAQVAAPSAAGDTRTEASATSPKTITDNTHYTSRDVAKRPYTALIPAPLYPSTPRVAKQFKVEYLYNYAETTYTPAVSLSQISRGAAKFTSPEDTMTAYYSAMRSGDYEAWLLCWDEPSRKTIVEATKANGGPEYWRKLWRQYFAGKQAMMIDRIETVNFFIMDTTVVDPAKPASSTPYSIVLVHQGSGWAVSNLFTGDALVMNHDDHKDVVSTDHELTPLNTLNGPALQIGDAQQIFLRQHNKASSATQTVE